MPCHDQPIRETLVGILPGACEDQRLSIVMVHRSGGTELIMRQESQSDVGWFEQSRIALEPQQLASLKAMLGATGSGSIRQAQDYDYRPRDILSFQSASQAG